MPPRRNRKNGKFSRQTRRRRTKPKTNLTNLAVSALVANSVSQGVFNLNLKDFFFDDGANQLNPTRGQQISFKELISGITGGDAGTAGVMKGMKGPHAWGTTLGGQLQENIKMNIMPLTVGIVGIPIAAKVISKLLRKPVILPLNRAIKATGLDVKV